MIHGRQQLHHRNINTTAAANHSTHDTKCANPT